MRVILNKADEGGKVSVSEVWNHLNELMGKRHYEELYDPLEGRLWVTVSSEEGVTELFFKDIDNGVFVYVTWKYDSKEEKTYRECESWEELEYFVSWAIKYLEN
jgi:hypothetical protein